MAKKKINFIENDLQPGLFDSIVEMSPNNDLPIHPSIAAEAERLRKQEQIAREAGRLVFFSFGSGSSGNCSYLGDDQCGVIIDAGIDVDRVVKGLEQNGISPEKIDGIILTHDHSDHVRYVYSLVRKFHHLAIYSTPRTLNGMLRRHSISRRVQDFHRPIYKEFPFKIGNLEITAFDVSHDGTDNVGYHVNHAPSKQQITIATDLGCITDRVDHYMRLADHIVIEANYDYRMLLAGRYPEYLKRRIMAVNGHLDNAETARFLSSIVSERLKNIWLCHLSNDNNTPDIALQTVRSALLSSGISSVGDGSWSLESRVAPLQLCALPRHECSSLFILS